MNPSCSYIYMDIHLLNIENKNIDHNIVLQMSKDICLCIDRL